MKTKLLAAMLTALVFGMAGCEQPEGPNYRQGAEPPAAAEEGVTYVGATDDNTPVELFIGADTYAVKVGEEVVSSGAATEAAAGTRTLQPEGGGEPFTAKAGEDSLTLEGPITDTLDGEDLRELYLVNAPPDAADGPDGGAADYRISLSVPVIHVFPPASAGYEAQAATTVTVTNTGTQPTGDLVLARAGTNGDSFLLSKITVPSIGAGGTAAFTIAPTIGLRAGTYTAKVTAFGYNDISAVFNVRFTVNNKTDASPPDAEDPASQPDTEAPPDAPKPDYRINLSQTGTLVFDDEKAGYDALTPQTITISNTGSKATGRLTVALSGENSGAFTRSPASMPSIEAGGSATFTIVPKTGQKTGTYAATVTVSGPSNSTGTPISASFDVSFTVYIEPIYGISLSQSGTLAFGEAFFGYPARTPQSITITNKGNQPTGPLTIALAGDKAESFTLSRTAIEEGLAPNGEADFTIAPNRGLGEGGYTATVTVSWSNGGAGAPVTAGFGVSFTVKPVPAYGIELDANGEYAFPSAFFGYGEQPVKKVAIHNTGNQETGGLTVSAGTGFEISAPANGAVNSIQAGGEASFSVRPKRGLEVGGYSATVSVSGGENIETQSFEVSFLVETVPEYGISVSTGEASGDFARGD